jgi:glyoxylase-like metal-dependent hydrolase (beta-lactamase superfamily II)
MKQWNTTHGYTVTRLIFGRCNLFLISAGNDHFLVDSGVAGDRSKITSRLKNLGITRLSGLIMTHTHFDHSGNAAWVKSEYGAGVYVQKEEAAFLISGNSPIPKGTVPLTKLIYRAGPWRVPHWFSVPGVTPDFIVDEQVNLCDTGKGMSILHTPGHSRGSCSVIVDGEIALAGDALGGFIPGSAFPPWGDDPVNLIHSWKKLLDTGCNRFHPAHGFPVSREQLLRNYRNRIRQIT